MRPTVADDIIIRCRSPGVLLINESFPLVMKNRWMVWSRTGLGGVTQVSHTYHIILRVCVICYDRYGLAVRLQGRYENDSICSIITGYIYTRVFSLFIGFSRLLSDISDCSNNSTSVSFLVLWPNKWSIWAIWGTFSILILPLGKIEVFRQSLWLFTFNQRVQRIWIY